MKKHLKNATQLIRRNSEFLIGAGIVGALVGAVAIVALVNHFSGPVIVHQPAKACDLFTLQEARSLLGEDVLQTESNKPVITGDVAVSKCSYTDTVADPTQMTVAAVAVRSGINDEGLARNVADFAVAKSNNSVEKMENLGEDAYFNKTIGQLNVLSGKKWIIMSYGIGSAPESNTLDQAKVLAQKVITK